MRNRDYELWVKDVEYFVRIKSANPYYHIEENQDDYPLGQMYEDWWAAGDVADEIVNKVNYN